MKVVSLVITIILIIGLSALCVWQLIKLIKDIKKYRASKKIKIDTTKKED